MLIWVWMRSSTFWAIRTMELLLLVMAGKTALITMTAEITPAMTRRAVVMTLSMVVLLPKSQRPLAGGVESVSLVQNNLNKHHYTEDWLMRHKPELWMSMIETADIVAERYGIDRRAQDDYALTSQKRTAAAQQAGRFDDEIVAVDIPQPKGSPTVFDVDEHPRQDASLERLAQLRPAFDKEGTVTAANASTINDGAAALVVASEEWAAANGKMPMAKIVATAQHSQKPNEFTTAPIAAIEKVLAKADLTLDDIDLFEINEAFAVVSLAAQDALGIPTERLNVNGGSVAIGHPIGASGARILTTLLYAMQQRDAKRGLAAICIGGGEATAIVVERG